MKSHTLYRPEIDGLRAVAVVAVVLYHAQISVSGVSLFRGGYLGVDIFFVISGYLITRLIIHDLNVDKFSFKEFYIRRARRILPVLFLVILVTLPIAWVLMLPQPLEEFSSSVLAAMTMTSNFLFWQQDSYWAVENELNPLLHTWSLAIEEQFYIIFPPLLFVVWKYAKRYMAIILSLIIAASFFATVLTVRSSPEAAFYLPYNRAWELGLGALLAIAESRRQRHLNSSFGTIFSIVGLLAILVPIFLFDSETLHPSSYTALPVLGACLLIWFCIEDNPVTSLLSKWPFVKFGLLSYGWYLWHYPLFAFARIYNDNLGNFEMLALSMLSLCLAWCSYHLLEQPMRNGLKVNLRKFSITTSTTFVSIMAIASYALLDNGNVGRFAERQLALLGLGNGKGDHHSYVVSEYDKRARGKYFSNSDRKKVLLIGDSFSQDFYNILREAKLLDDLELAAHYLPGRCQNVPAHEDYLKHVREKDKARCSKVIRVGDEELNSRIRKADGVIVVSRWNDYTTSKVLELQNTIKGLGGKNILIVGRKNFPKPEKFQEYLNSQNTNKKNAFVVSKAQRRMVEKFKEIEKSLDHFLDLHKLACDKGNRCPVATPDGFLISHDRDHLTEEGAKYFAQLIKTSPAFDNFWKLTHTPPSK